ncbi:four-carbon acid sugar kinase family protein [Pseudonocardia eucalypti]|uniref:Four-carbon acid sugar kinase family protein n=1 Tax=Pseudonocardia eucalypti TaxID=648755 RepID=A0ABP9RBJ3_9PSEU|nr:uncharacterized protein YgbK (DUF1537 family) [Pseudonocardia eucalypti]
MTGPQVGVLADDLTGALASAAMLRESGLPTSVRWRREEPPARAGGLVVDMRTRDYGADPRERAASWAAYLRSVGAERIELRIDSTLRGAPALELEGVVAGAGLADPWLLAVPAFPSAGRTVVGGCLHAPGVRPPVHGMPVGPALFGPARVASLGRDVLDAGPDAVLAAMLSAGGPRFAADGETEEHLRTMAEVAGRLVEDGQPLITVSPGAWLRHHRGAARPRYPLVVLSSPTETNREQLATLGERYPALAFPAGELLAGECAPDWAALTGPPRAVPESPTHRARNPDSPVLVVETLGAATRDAGPAWVQSTVAAKAAAWLVEEAARHGVDCGGIVVGGGATGSALMDALGVPALDAEAEIAPLCPRSRVTAGRWAGLPVITKGGLVGGPETLSQLVAALLKEIG